MYPKSVQKLIELFTKFPGIGPRQAARFAFFILKGNKDFLSDLISSLKSLQEGVGFCTLCFRSMERIESNVHCNLCRDDKREKTLIAVVEKESDLHNMEKTNAYRGIYHVLGGVISPLDPDSPKKIHLRELHARVTEALSKNGDCEVILATNPTAEGDTTALYIDRVLAPLKEQHPKLKISRLGRGLSLGSELEHVDEVTLKSALTNRK